jgi:surface antigen
MKRTMIAVAVLIWPLVGFTPGFGQGFAGPEQQAMTDTFQYALENNRLNQGAEWVNPDTGRAGVVAPTRTFNNSQGQPCREFIQTIIIGDKEEQGYGTACRQPDGNWQVVATQQQLARPPQPSTVYVHTPADRYYAYPSEVYSRFPIYLSFSNVFRHGTAFRGTYHMSGFDYRHRYPARIKQRVIVVPKRYEPYRRHEGLQYKEKYRYREDWRDNRNRGPGKGWRSEKRH